MQKSVKRKYDSSRRREQARQTRLQIIRAAHDLFVGNGYGATTVNDIARAAGVAAVSVYATFGSKVNLLRKVWDVTIGGDDQPIPFAERPEIRELRAEQDPARRLEMFASLFAHEIAPRTAPFMRATRGAAASEPDARRVADEMDRQRLKGLTMTAREIIAGDGVVVSEEEVRDVLWATTSGDLWHLLVVECEWDADRFASWLGNLWKRMLLQLT